ncbi:MAG: zinc ribbon domain-containing protein [Ignavibacteria bacterium]
MKERLKLLYELNKIDKELNELYGLKGDIPEKINELTGNKDKLEARLSEIKAELNEVEAKEKVILKDNDSLTKKIDKNDELLRSGAVNSNDEYDALAKEIEDAYDKIAKNELVMKDEVKSKKDVLTVQLTDMYNELEEMKSNLKDNKQELAALNEQTEEEERDLKQKRETLVPQINKDDLEYYDRINTAKFGDAIAIVRKGSCLGCYNAIPPQRVIEIRMAERFFHCESCGRILISEEFVEA